MSRLFDDKYIIDFISEVYTDILTEREAQVWVGREVLSWKTSRIAQALGIANSTVKTTMRRISHNVLPEFGEILVARHICVT